MRYLLAVILPLLFLSPLHAENKFDFATTPGKLPKDVVPSRYAIRIAPNLDQLTFTGSETVQLEAKTPVKRLVLNALDLAITSASIDGQALPKNAIALDAKEQILTLTLPNELTAGQHELALKFTGKINPQGQGLFYARYQEEGSATKKILLGTQFEATDARRMFPCWDEPSFRAKFQLTTLVPNEFMAVSNMPIEEEKKTDAGKEVRFGETPAMSSYLVVFCAGDFETIEGEQDGVKLRIVTTKGKAEQGRYALESTGKILHYYNEYFGVPYPLPKLDLIALPGGFGGAMENWGGITYYESVLLFDPKTSATSTKQDVFAVIAHEMAHQWFGDLVTMAWWDNLWLNEGFASWMGSKCTDHFNPDWAEWLRRSVPRSATRRVGSPKDAAMQSDARSTTHPVQREIKTEAQAGSAFDEITYRKGQSIIRMLESFLGADVFRDGIRKYMGVHKYSNTTTADLWDALTEVSGKPIGEIAPAWTEQPGFPLVKFSRDGISLKLTQERFTVHFENPPALQWQIPLTYGVEGVPTPDSFLLRDQAATLPTEVPNDRAVKLNVADAGYYRVAYDDASWQLLLKVVGGMSEADQLNLLTDAWAQVEAGDEPLAHYLELAEKLTDKDQLNVFDQIIDTFVMIDRLLVGDPLRPRFQQYAHGLIRPSFDRVGWEPKKGEPLPIALLRVSLLRGLGLLNDSDISANARSRFDKFLEEPSALPPDLRPTVFSIVGRYANSQTWEKLHRLGEKTTSTEEKGNYYEALGQTTNPGLISRYLQISLGDELPTSRASAILGFSARYGEHPDLVWDFAKTHMKALLAKQDALGINSFAAGLFNFYSDPKDIETLEAYAKASLPPAAAESVARAVDEIGFRAEFKQRLVPQLKQWIQKHSSSSVNDRR